MKAIFFLFLFTYQLTAQISIEGAVSMVDIQKQIYSESVYVNLDLDNNLILYGGLERNDTEYKANEESGEFDDLINRYWPYEQTWVLGPYTYHNYNESLTSKVGIGYKINVLDTFHIQIGASLNMATVIFYQIYNIMDTSGTRSNKLLISDPIQAILVEPQVQIKYNITESISLNISYSYAYQISIQNDVTYNYENANYCDNYAADPIWYLFGIIPALDPDGNEHDIDLSGHKFSLGISYYFGGKNAK
jgi:hypothetical protein